MCNMCDTYIMCIPFAIMINTEVILRIHPSIKVKSKRFHFYTPFFYPYPIQSEARMEC